MNGPYCHKVQFFCSSVADLLISGGEWESKRFMGDLLLVCGCAARAYSHEVEASECDAALDEQENDISFKVKEPCLGPRGSDDVGSETGSGTRGDSECMAKGIYTDENSTTEICMEVAYFPSSYAEESESHTSGIMEVVTVNAMMDDDGVEGGSALDERNGRILLFTICTNTFATQTESIWKVPARTHATSSSANLTMSAAMPTPTPRLCAKSLCEIQSAVS
jgi:hypothetical protein